MIKHKTINLVWIKSQITGIFLDIMVYLIELLKKKIYEFTQWNTLWF